MPYLILQKKTGGDPYTADVLVYFKLDDPEYGLQDGTCEIGGAYTNKQDATWDGSVKGTINIETPQFSIPSSSPFTIDFKYYTLTGGSCGWGDNNNHYLFQSLDVGNLALSYVFGGPDWLSMCGSYANRHNLNCGVAGQWNHMAFVRETDGKIYRYINGVKNTAHMADGTCGFTNLRLRFGGGLLLDRIRITKVARWTSDFDPNGLLYPAY